MELPDPESLASIVQNAANLPVPTVRPGMTAGLDLRITGPGKDRDAYLNDVREALAGRGLEKGGLSVDEKPEVVLQDHHRRRQRSEVRRSPRRAVHPRPGAQLGKLVLRPRIALYAGLDGRPGTDSLEARGGRCPQQRSTAQRRSGCGRARRDVGHGQARPLGRQSAAGRLPLRHARRPEQHPGARRGDDERIRRNSKSQSEAVVRWSPRL